MSAPTILIIGATGIFGSRLAAHLARTSNLKLLLASRSITRATAAVATLEARKETLAALVPVALDTAGPFEPNLIELKPTVVVDCSGPFQAMAYRTPLAALAAGAHFVDLSDARGYLLGFRAALDAKFRDRRLVALGGASSSPALSAAVVADLTRGWQRVDHIEVAIVPAGQSEVGEAAIAGALSYCGAPVPVIEGGLKSSEIGWARTDHVWLDGRIRRAVAPVETADAELLAERYPGAASIRFRAGLESRVEQTSMRLLAALKRVGLIDRPQRLTAPLTQAGRLTRAFTSSTGGMIVRAVGLDAAGVWTEAEWHLIAQNNHGLHVPPSPAIAAVRSILRGTVTPGARPALDLQLGAIEAEFKPYAIETRRITQTTRSGLMEQTVGARAYATLPDAVRAYHDVAAPVIWSGCADVTEGRNLLARLAASLFGLPSGGRNIPVQVMTERRARADGLAPTETWRRSFGSKRFFSIMDASMPGRATECFPPLTFDLGLSVHDRRLLYPVTGWRLGWLRLPKALAPRSVAAEWEDAEGRFNFDVQLSLPLVGLLAHYRGWLTPGVPSASAVADERE